MALIISIEGLQHDRSQLVTFNRCGQDAAAYMLTVVYTAQSKQKTMASINAALNGKASKLEAC